MRELIFTRNRTKHRYEKGISGIESENGIHQKLENVPASI